MRCPVCAQETTRAPGDSLAPPVSRCKANTTGRRARCSLPENFSSTLAGHSGFAFASLPHYPLPHFAFFLCGANGRSRGLRSEVAKAWGGAGFLWGVLQRVHLSSVNFFFLFGVSTFGGLCLPTEMPVRQKGAVPPLPAGAPDACSSGEVLGRAVPSRGNQNSAPEQTGAKLPSPHPSHLPITSPPAPPACPQPRRVAGLRHSLVSGSMLLGNW